MAKTQHIIVSALILAVALIGLNIFTLMSDTSDVVMVEVQEAQHVEDTVKTYGSNTFADVVDSVANTIETQRSERNERRSKTRIQSRHSAAIEEKIQEEGKARVIVTLKDTSKRADVIAKLGSSKKLVDYADSIVVEATDSKIVELASDENVKSVVRDLPLEVAWDAESFSLVALNETLNYALSQGIDVSGSGQSVCVIDSGLESNHGAFNSENYLTYGQKVAYGYDYHDNDIDWDDNLGHGTGVAGVIAGNSSSYTGMLPKARVVVMKVTDNLGQGWSSSLEKAVEDCRDNRTLYNITTIVIPLKLLPSDENLTPDLCPGDPAADAIQSAIDVGMNVIAPSGNDGRTDSIAYPAVCENVTSVAGVWDYTASADDVWTTSNRHASHLDMLAPANRVYAPGLTNSYGQAVGTSMGAGIVAGASMILEEVGIQKYGTNYNPEEIRDILMLTGDSISDPVLPVSFPRLNIERAIHHETVPPTVSLDTADNSWSDDTVELNFTPDDTHHDLTLCEVYVDGSLNGSYANPTNNQQITHTTGMSGGAHDWFVQCWDNATFANAKNSSTYTISVDDVLPIVTLLAPPNATVVNHTNIITFNYSVDDWNDVTTCSLNVDTVVVDSMSSPQRNTTLSFQEQALSNGAHTWYVTCTDVFGNTQTMPTYMLTIDVPTEPTLNGLPNRNVNEDTTPPSQWIDLHSYAADPDNITSELTFSITSQTNAALVSCSVVSDRYIECGTPAANQSGSNNVTVEVSDGVDTDSDDFTVTVAEVNDIPTLSNMPTQDLDENSGSNSALFNVETYATDVETAIGSLIYTIESETNTGVVDCSLNGHLVDCAVQPGQLGTSVVTIKVDDGSDSSTNTFTVNINNVNDAPTLSGLPDKDVDEDGNPANNWIDLSSYASDPDNASTALFYSVISQSNTSLISCSVANDHYLDCNDPTADKFGTSDITVEASDGEFTDTDTLTVTVNPVNDAPSVGALPNQNLLENSGNNDDVIDISSYVTDIDGPSGNISCAVVHETNSGVVTCSVDGNDKLDCNVQPSQLGSSTVTVEVTDSIASVNTTVVISVGNVNDPPVMAALPAQNVDEDGSPANNWIDLASYVNDPDNASTTLFYTITSETNSALIDCSINSGHYLDCADPAADGFGTSDVTIEVDDGEFTDSETVTITVNSINDAPVFSSISNQPLMENSGMNQDVVDLESYASDVETSASSLTYSIVSETAPAIVDCSIDGSNNLDCDVQNGQSGTSTVTVLVSDGDLNDTETFDVIVQQLPNQAPSITNLPAGVNGSEGSLITYDVDASDPDVDPLTFSIVSGSEPGMSIDPNTGDFSWTPTFAQSGTYNVGIEVSDGSLTDTETLTVTVADVVPVDDYELMFVLVQMGAGTQSQTFSYLLKNTGSNPITSFDYLLWDGLEANHSDTVTPGTPIAPGQTYAGMIPVTYSTTGSGTADLTIDPLDTVLELDENNNQQTVGITVN